MNNLKVYIDAAGQSDTGKVRSANEDSFAAFDLSLGEKFVSSFEWKKRPIEGKRILFVVADGMGGAKAGEIASRAAVEFLGDILGTPGDTQFDKAQMEGHIRKVNQEVRSVAESNSDFSGMGTTLTTVLINDGKAILGQIGDSRCYLLRNGCLTRLTKDQSLVQALVDAGKLTPEQADVSPQKNVILSAIGAEREIEPVTGEIDLEHGDYLLLCSDGLTNMVNEDEMREILSRNLTMRKTCRLLIKLANRNGGNDNITVIVAQFCGKGIPPAAEETAI